MLDVGMGGLFGEGRVRGAHGCGELGGDSEFELASSGRMCSLLSSPRRVLSGAAAMWLLILVKASMVAKLGSFSPCVSL